MRCRVCNYVLWNLRTRQCPECGEAFAPSQYEFVPSTVRFCCPHCDRGYLGTDATGLLQPREFSCEGCNEHISMDEMVLRPEEGLEDWQTQVEKVSWAEARGAGRIGAWFTTVWRAMVMPNQLLTAVPRANATRQAWGFAFVTSVAVAVGVLLPLLLIGFLIAGLIAAGGGIGSRELGIITGFTALMVVASVASILLTAALWGAVAHLVLRISGPVDGSIGRTYQAICYSSGANVASAVPCVGYYFGWVWWAISAAFMLMSAQRVSGLRATVAAVGFPVALYGAMFAAYFALVFAVPAFSTTGFGSVGAAPATSRLVNAAVQYANRNNGQLPAHAGQIILDGPVEPLTFVISGSNTQPMRVPLGDTDLQRFMWLTYGEQRQEVQRAVDTTPENLTAHRLGDVVLCWHGININTADSRLWLFIVSLDPDANASTDVNGYRHVGLANGRTERIAVADWDGALTEQNALRAAEGLPPLPQPDRVRHGQPAFAP